MLRLFFRSNSPAYFQLIIDVLDPPKNFQTEVFII